MPKSKVELPKDASPLDWGTEFCEILKRNYGKKQGKTLFRMYRSAFPPGFSEAFSADRAAEDVGRVEKMRNSGRIALNLYRPFDDAPNEFRLGLYHLQRPVPLSDIIPMLENMGLKVIDEIPYRICVLENLDPVWLHDFGFVTESGKNIEINDSAKVRFEDAFHKIWLNEIENDGLNALILATDLTWRQVVILRAYTKYLLQAHVGFSQTYIEDTLVRNATVASDIVSLFEISFDPGHRKKSDQVRSKIRQRILDSLQSVVSLEQDRLLRRFLNLVEATLRTNFYQRSEGDTPRPCLALKLDSKKIDNLPLPRPFREIFVHSSRVDGIHLRGGLVARGGLRWSDRKEDFRDEILGLMKSQMTKNSVIVPVGAKGGFFVKNLPGTHDRDAILREGIDCYKIFVSGLLDVTDNIENGRVVPPPMVVRRDGDDPYLVVAADKGTSTFSDIANEISSKYGFWLGDAFASGGSQGYDHKAMGITARGAWESVRRHFREIGSDPMEQDFSCVAIGDMSGDVFGNGLIYSPHTKLLAAFNHLHIFIDPDPDPETSFRERKRLFGKAKSRWSDYRMDLISKGGGVFERSVKSINISPEMRKIFKLRKGNTITPDELIRVILGAKVDLIWFGGIGTYIKSSSETNLDVGDRVNDSIRVNADEVGASIIGEGANLGITQLGRVQFAQKGGKINTDFIDNSAGVDCSDHEVNIKILLNDLISKKKLTKRNRDSLLKSMTVEVSKLVLMDNYRQSMALTNAEHQSAQMVTGHKKLIKSLEESGELNRYVEFLPEDSVIDQRRAMGGGLFRPELAVLLTYSKNALFQDIVESSLPEDPYLAKNLPLYFPSPLQSRFKNYIKNHPLRREIIATYAANTLINRTGPSFVCTLQERTGVPPAEVARAYFICRQIFGLSRFWSSIEELDNSVAAETQSEMHMQIIRLIEHVTEWFIVNGKSSGMIDEVVAVYKDPVSKLFSDLDKVLVKEISDLRNRMVRNFREKNVPSGLAENIAKLAPLTSACDMVDIAVDCKKEIGTVANLYYTLGSRFGISWLMRVAGNLADGDEWKNSAVLGLTQDLNAAQVELTRKLVKNSVQSEGNNELLDRWMGGNSGIISEFRSLIRELKSVPSLELPMLVVATQKIRRAIEKSVPVI